MSISARATGRSLDGPVTICLLAGQVGQHPAGNAHAGEPPVRALPCGAPGGCRRGRAAGGVRARRALDDRVRSRVPLPVTPWHVHLSCFGRLRDSKPKRRGLDGEPDAEWVCFTSVGFLALWHKQARRHMCAFAVKSSLPPASLSQKLASATCFQLVDVTTSQCP